MDVWLCSWCHPVTGRLRIRTLNKEYKFKHYGLCDPEKGCGRSGTVYSKDKVEE